MTNIRLLFPEGKRKAFTTSYDDGVHQDKRLVECMNKNGVRGTFNLNSGRLGIEEKSVIHDIITDVSKIKADEISSIYEGHEIASHSLTHMNFQNVADGTIAYQIIEDRKNLEQLRNDFVQGFAYPYGFYNKKIEQILGDCGIHYARTVCSTNEFDLPQDFLAWNPTCHHDNPELFNLLKKFCEEKDPNQKPELFYLWGHAYEFDQKNNWNRIEEAFSYIHRFKKDIWMATNGMIYDYLTAFQALEYSADGSLIYNKTAQIIWLEIDDRQYALTPGDRIVCRF